MFMRRASESMGFISVVKVLFMSLYQFILSYAYLTTAQKDEPADIECCAGFFRLMYIQ